MSVHSKSLVDAIAPATNPRSETMVVGCGKGPIHSIKVLLNLGTQHLCEVNAMILPADLPLTQRRTAESIAYSCCLLHDLVLSRAWSTPERKVQVWARVPWALEMHQLHKVAKLPQPVGIQILIP